MKKTLIALAVAVSAVVSGSAMAWDANGTGGNVDLSGTLTPSAKVTPWEVKVGAAVTGLDAPIQKGQKAVDIAVNKAIPVLGIRNANANGFAAQKGIKPQIDYQGHVDINGFKDGITTVNLNVQDENKNQIGSLVAPFSAAALSSWDKGSSGNPGKKILLAASANDAFYGGLAKVEAGVALSRSESLISGLSSEFLAKWKAQGDTWRSGEGEQFENTSVTKYYGAYGAGIEQNKVIKITLDKAAEGDAPIKWKASLPVTVSYQ